MDENNYSEFDKLGMFLLHKYEFNMKNTECKKKKISLTMQILNKI